MARAEEDWVITAIRPMPPSPPRRVSPPIRRAVSPWTIRRCWPGWLATPPPIKGCPCSSATMTSRLTRELYRGARLDEILVKRTISRNGGGRNKVAELLALYRPASSPNRAIIPVRRSWLPSAE